MRRDIGTDPGLATRIVRKHLPEWPSRVVDLGCGDGVFLEAVLSGFLEAHPHLSTDALAGSVTGVEVDDATACKARKRLTASFGTPTSRWNVLTRDALSIPDVAEYDFAIGNPPWIRVHHLEPSQRTRLRAAYRSAFGPYDLSYLFVEKALRLLKPSGALALIVPRGIAFQPAAAPLRALLTSAGIWSMDALPPSLFTPNAGIDPGLLSLRKMSPMLAGEDLQVPARTFGDVADVTAGIATGADRVFVIPTSEVAGLGIEPEFVRPAVRGRDIRRGDVGSHSLVWPYRLENGRYRLVRLEEAPMLSRYLRKNRGVLESRPRLAHEIARHPADWYRYIGPGKDATRAIRFAIPDIFGGAGYEELTSEAPAVLNTCFEIAPKAGNVQTVREILGSSTFWRTLSAVSRRLNGPYHRTSATELRAIPLD